MFLWDACPTMGHALHYPPKPKPWKPTTSAAKRLTAIRHSANGTLTSDGCDRVGLDWAGRGQSTVSNHGPVRRHFRSFTGSIPKTGTQPTATNTRYMAGQSVIHSTVLCKARIVDMRHRIQKAG
jgi:hypothetical protein